MKKLSLVLAAMIAASSISFYGTAAFAEETGLDYDGSVNVAFGNTTGSSSANSETGNPPSWIKDIYSTATPAPASTKDPNATPEPTKNPDATPEPTAAPTQKPSATQPPNEVRAGTPEADVVKVPILLYHHISDDFDSSNAISIISPRDFRLHMTAIKTQYTPISLRDYVDFVKCRDGSKTIPTNPIIITFDDGYSSNYEVAFPILKELEIPATIFVVTDTVGATKESGKVNYSHFTWEQAKEMQDSGLIDIESHTNDHLKLGELDKDTLNYELRKSKYLIEKNLGKTCDMIAYPYGSYSDIAIDASHKAGFIAQCLVGDDATDIDYEVNIPRDGVENMTRITVSGLMGNVNVIELIRQAVSNKIIN